MAAGISREYSGCNFIPPYVLESFGTAMQAVSAEQTSEAPFMDPEQDELQHRREVLAPMLIALGKGNSEQLSEPRPRSAKPLSPKFSSDESIRISFDAHHPKHEDNVLYLKDLVLEPDPPEYITTCLRMTESINQVFQKHGLFTRSLIRFQMLSPELLTCRFDRCDLKKRSIKIGFSETKLILTQSLINNMDCLAHTMAHHVIDEIKCKSWHTPGEIGCSEPRQAKERRILDEHFADVLTISVKHTLCDEGKPKDWNIGTGMFHGQPGQMGFHLRSMNAPGTAHQGHAFLRNHAIDLPADLLKSNPAIQQIATKLFHGDDPQPSSLASYADINYDRGGEHIFSGIFNRAFFLFTTFLKQNSFEHPLEIWIGTLRHINPNADFKEFATTTLHMAIDVAGTHNQSAMVYMISLAHAWKTVGMVLDIKELNAVWLERCVTAKSSPLSISTVDDTINGVPVVAELIVAETWEPIVKDLYYRWSKKMESIVLYSRNEVIQGVVFIDDHAIELSPDQIWLREPRGWIGLFSGECKPLNSYSLITQVQAIRDLKSKSRSLQVSVERTKEGIPSRVNLTISDNTK